MERQDYQDGEEKLEGEEGDQAEDYLPGGHAASQGGGEELLQLLQSRGTLSYMLASARNVLIHLLFSVFTNDIKVLRNKENI